MTAKGGTASIGSVGMVSVGAGAQEQAGLFFTSSEKDSRKKWPRQYILGLGFNRAANLGLSLSRGNTIRAMVCY